MLKICKNFFLSTTTDLKAAAAFDALHGKVLGSFVTSGPCMHSEGDHLRSPQT